MLWLKPRKKLDRLPHHSPKFSEALGRPLLTKSGPVWGTRHKKQLSRRRLKTRNECPTGKADCFSTTISERSAAEQHLALLAKMHGQLTDWVSVFYANPTTDTTKSLGETHFIPSQVKDWITVMAHATSLLKMIWKIWEKNKTKQQQLNETGRKRPERRYFLQQTKHAKLYSDPLDPLQTLNREPLIALISLLWGGAGGGGGLYFCVSVLNRGDARPEIPRTVKIDIKITKVAQTSARELVFLSGYG